MFGTRVGMVAGAGGFLALVVVAQSCAAAPPSAGSPSGASPSAAPRSAAPPSAGPLSAASPPAAPSPIALPLPSPRTAGFVSVEEALASRRSVREFSSRPLDTGQIGQLLWAAQGVTDAEGHRTAPSAGALYPLELYAVTGEGTFRYLPAEHALVGVRRGDLRQALRAASLGQEAVGNAPLAVVITAVTARSAARYGPDRAVRYVQLEAGHAAQNLLLEAVALGLGAVPVGAFDDSRVAAVLGLPAGETPLYVIPVGYPATATDR